MSIKTNTLYIIERPDGNGTDYGISPDGEGMYWYDTKADALRDLPTAYQIHAFDSPRKFDDFRYGPLV